MFPLFFIFLVDFFCFLLALVSYERESLCAWLTKSGETPPVSMRYVWGKGWRTGAILLFADGMAKVSLPPVQKAGLSCLLCPGS